MRKRSIIAAFALLAALFGYAGLGPSAAAPQPEAGLRLDNSFTSRTIVQRADGTRARIADVAEGDFLLATDPATGRTTKEQVTQVIRGTGDRHLYGIDLVGAPADQRIHATVRHAFFARGIGYVEVQDLRPGDYLLRGDGSFSPVRNVADLGIQQLTVYNLRLTGPNTFLVVADGASVVTFGA